MKTIRLIKIEKSETDSQFLDAKQSYYEIYDACMSKGKGENIIPEFMGGNPIQLDVNNMNSLFIANSENVVYNDYFVSTKADGLRFMLFIGNKNETRDNERYIYFVDSKMNFWYIKDLPPIKKSFNLDKCLIDGELLFWGTIETKLQQDEIKEYTLTNNPLIGFLAFDILYGPTNPSYETKIPAEEEAIFNIEHQKHLEPMKYVLGSNGSMVGFKAAGRWPTTRRRHVLEEMISNQDSPMWKYIHTDQNQTLYNSNFTIFVSPFLKMKEVLKQPDGAFKGAQEIYNQMIKVLHADIESQYFYVDFPGNKHNLTLPVIVKNKIDNQINTKILTNGKGYSTDGLIFTPSGENYLVGPWRFCNNKQYKWKPKKDLTIDFKIGERISNNLYFGCVAQYGKIVNFQYEMNNIKYTAVIHFDQQSYKQGDIVECECEYNNIDEDNDKIIFTILKKRFDKKKPNAFLSAESVLDAADIKNELKYLKDIISISDPTVLDLVIIIPSEERKKYILEQTLKLTDKNIIDKAMNALKKTRQHLLGKSDDKKLGEIMTDILSSCGKNKLIKCCVSQHYPLEIFGSQENIKKMMLLIQKRQFDTSGNFELELRLNLNERHSDHIKYDYTKCLINTLLSSDYKSVPIVKIFKKNKDRTESSKRSIYTMISSDIIFLEETIDKKKLDSVNIIDNIFNYKFDLVLSEEIKTSDEIKYRSSDAGISQYQNRYVVTYLSNFWRVDIIEYGEDYNIDNAKLKWQQSPKTRIDIEYAPISYLKDLINWKKEYSLEDIKQIELFLKKQIKDAPLLKQLHDSLKSDNLKEMFDDENVQNTIKKLHNILQEYRKIENILKSLGIQYLGDNELNSYVQKLNTTDPLFILKDLANILIKIFTILDMDLGNTGQPHSQENSDEKPKKPEKLTIAVVPKKNTISIFQNMKNFHNNIKQNLIKDVALHFNNPTLLDVSVGRGGDIDKWFKAGIHSVYAIDPDTESINGNEGAKSRFVNNPRVKGENYTFEVARITDDELDIPNTYNIVSCQFTLHYIFENDAMLDIAIRNISSALKKEGYFIGTTLVGKNVRELVQNNNYPEKVYTKKIDENSYYMKLLDVEESTTYDKSELQEYYVDLEKLEKVCKKYRLKKVEYKLFSDLYKNYRVKNLNDYEYAVSCLNASFIFKKL